MPLETATYISDLVATNPAHTDGLSQADSHMRLIKSALKATFPSFVGAAATITEAQLTTLGAALSTTGILRARGTVAVGAIVDFPKAPTARFSAGGTAAGGESVVDWLELDGSLYNVADFPTLGAFLGSTFGGNGTTTFAVPNLTNTGRYRRSRTTGVSAGGYQANQNSSHVHGVSGSTDTDPGHFHSAISTAGVSDPGHSHGYTHAASTLSLGSAGASAFIPPAAGATTDAAVTGISVSVSTVIASSGAHFHSFNVTSAATGGTEARPETFVVVACIKT